MEENKTIRLPFKHFIFVKELVKTGDAEAAYGKAYPGSSPASRKPAACRLASRPEVKQQIEEKQAAAMQKGFEAAEAEAAERYKQDFLSLYEMRAKLATLVRGQARMNRYYKQDGKMETMVIPVDNPFAILRAIEMAAKLEAQYYAKKPKEEKQPKTIETGKDKVRFFIYFDKKAFDDKSGEGDLTDEEYDNLLRASLTNPDINVTKPTLSDDLRKLGCHIERNMETGKYEAVCPADRIIVEGEGENIRYKGIMFDSEEEEKQYAAKAAEKSTTRLANNPNEKSTTGLTFVNINSSQPTEKQEHQKNNNNNPPSQNDVPNHKSHIINQPIEKHPSILYPSSLGTGNQEWVPISEVVQDYWDHYIHNQNGDNNTRHKNIVKLARSRNLPPEERKEIEEITGWQYHPEKNNFVKRTRRNCWPPEAPFGSPQGGK